MKFLLLLPRAAALALLMLATAPLVQAQTGVRIGTAGAPNAAAALDINATDKGLLIPRMDSATRVGIGTPPDGLMVFQTNGRKGFWYAMNGGWLFIPDKTKSGDNLGSHTATQNLNLAGNQLVGNGSSGLAIDNLGNVGLGTTGPTQKLDVRGNLRLGDDGGNVGGTGQAVEFVGPGVSTDPVGLYRLNPAVDQSELRVVVGDVADANDKFVVGRMDGTSTEGGIPSGTFTPTFSVSSAGQVVAAGLAGTGTRMVTTAADGTLAPAALPTDAQQLSISGSTLSLTNGGSVALPSGSTGDNLGNHIATQNINLNGSKVVGGTTDRAIRGGLSMNGNGLLTVGAPRPNTDSTTTFGVRLTDMDQDFVLTSKVFKGKINPLNVSGAGDRVMWLSYYSAFRAGGVSGNRWDYLHVGRYSAAFGFDNEVLGDYSAAFGYNNWVRFGQYNLFTGINNVGLLCEGAIMLGRDNVMRGLNGFAGGYDCKVQSSTSIYTPSFAFGYRSEARTSQSGCFALGYYARTGGFEGCFVLADYSPMRTNFINDSLVSTARNQYSARFVGGYRLFTTVATNGFNNGAGDGSNPPITPVGVQVLPGGNAWVTISDSTKKERIVRADGNCFLDRIGAMRLGSWNYKGQSADTMRHYGPMAQDFYAAFGHDGVGRIGNDTTINQADFDGVNLIAIQALYRRVQALEAETARQQQQLRQLQGQAVTAPAVPGTAAPTAPARRGKAARVAELRQQNAALQARTDTDHAALLQLQAQVARLLGEQATAEVPVHK